ncbi:MAG: hypothetical protein S4CHLAM2_12270 [Chlamydiales bacterium]|nr:hypothetical protein [Chlamydiales bacterium]
MIVIVANGQPPAPVFLQTLVQKSQKLVAVDGGLLACERADLTPDLIMGDFDSVSPELLKKYDHVQQIHTPDQNKNDLEKTLDYLAPFHSVTVCGAVGKRLDHTLSNLYLLCRYPGKMVFESDNERCFVLEKSTTLTCKVGQTLSLFPLGEPVQGVTSKGLQWELSDVTLDKHFVSISNKCEQQEVSITYKEGALIAILIH